MKRDYRLRLNSDFERVRREGQAYTSSLVVLVFLRNGLPHSRFGFVINRRLGGAVQRNKIKRRLKEATRLQMETMKPGFDLVFIARQPICQVAYRDIEQTVKNLVARGKLITHLTQWII